MNISGKDLNALYLFRVLYEERNLTNAAKRMALSQPALSHRLNRLRADFDDQLFVRAPRGLVTTPVAEQYAAEILDVVARIEALYQVTQPQDYLQQKDKIHIFSTDLLEALVMPGLIRRVRQHAPLLQLAMFNTRGRLPRTELERGTCDIAIAGFFNEIPDSYFVQSLSTHRFVVLAHRHNRKIENGLSLEEFVSCDHVIVTLSGDLTSKVDRALQNQGLTRRVVAGFSSFFPPHLLLAEQPDMLFVCLTPIAEMALNENPGLIYYPCPVPLPEIEFVQVWHQRTHQDPMRRWLRQQIKAVMQ